MKYMKLSKQSIALILFNLFLILNVHAQQSLTIVDCDSQTPLVDVSIFVQEEKELEWTFIGNTSTKGTISLDNLAANSTLMVTLLGYELQLIQLSSAMEQKSTCLQMVEVALTNLTIQAKIENPFVRYNGGALKDKVEGIQIVKPFLIQAKEVSISEFAEFVKETGYVTEVEKLKPTIKYHSGIELGDFKYFDTFKLFQEGNFRQNSKNKLKGFEWKVVRKSSDTLTWLHNNYGQPSGAEKNTFPVVNITYNDALAYAKWMGGRLPLIEEYRWIHKNDKKYLGWIYEVSGGGVYRTGTSPSNKFGVYDIYGNVAEYIFNPNGQVYQSRAFTVGHYSSRFNLFEISEYKDNLAWLEFYQKVGFRVVREVK